MKTIDFSNKRLGALQWISCLMLAIVAVLLPAAASAQSSSSAVNGVVTDSNQSVLAGAKVTLKNVDTNVERTTVTNNTGDYFFSSVVPARYTYLLCSADFRPRRSLNLR
jgi:hypothetical protein